MINQTDRKIIQLRELLDEPDFDVDLSRVVVQPWWMAGMKILGLVELVGVVIFYFIQKAANRRRF
jgi:hypothetical protein